MRRREFIALIGAGVAWPFAAMAQEPGRTYRLGVLFAAPRSDDSTTAFFEGVRRQGFIEGQNLTVIHHAFAMNPDLLPEWVAELVKARVDVIATVGDLCWWRGRPNQERSSKNCAPAGTASAKPAPTIASMITNRCQMRILLGLVISLRRSEFFA
jgi:hypothetical protein